MKRQKIVSIILLIILGLSVNCVYAENETNTTGNTTNSTNTATNTTNTTANNNSNTTNTSSNTNKEVVKTTQKSSNANLSNLGIKPNDFKGFKPATTTYEVTVPLSVEQIEIYATAQEKSASISGIGTKKLNEGLNEFSVVVTAENGVTKTYTLEITRTEDAKEDTTIIETEDTLENKGLSKLDISNIKQITPEFKPEVYEYNVKLIGEDTKLDLKVEPTDESYIVEISGNEDLKEGENIVTILVSDKNSENVATYQLIVNKSLIDEEEVARQKEEQQKMILNIVLGIVVVMMIIVVIMIIVRKRRNSYQYEEDEEPYEEPYEESYRESSKNKKEKGKRYR